MHQSSKETFYAEKKVADIATSFLSEGYILRFHSSSLSLCFYSLVHSSNGNHINVIGYPLKNNVTVKKNGKVIINRRIVDL